MAWRIVLSSTLSICSDHTARLRTRWSFWNWPLWLSLITRRTAVTVRLPGARIAPASKIFAHSPTRSLNSSSNARNTGIIVCGRLRMASPFFVVGPKLSVPCLPFLVYRMDKVKLRVRFGRPFDRSRSRHLGSPRRDGPGEDGVHSHRCRLYCRDLRSAGLAQRDRSPHAPARRPPPPHETAPNLHRACAQNHRRVRLRVRAVGAAGWTARWPEAQGAVCHRRHAQRRYCLRGAG